MSEAHGRRVLSPADLPPALAPRRDLWPGIAQAIAGLPQDAAVDPAAPRPAQGSAPGGDGVTAGGAVAAAGAANLLPWRGGRRSRAWHYGLGLAATVACLAIGAWIGRATLPAPGPVADPALQAAVFAPDARFARERQALLVQAGLGLARLAPQERRKVEASLATLRQAIVDIRRALGEDPGNLLLQEMLVNSYQDEIRVLSAVTEAGGAGQET